MPEDQELVAVRRFAVQPVVDLRVGAAQADAKHLHGDVIRRHRGIWHIAHVDAVLFSGPNDDGFHNAPIIGSQ